MGFGEESEFETHLTVAADTDIAVLGDVAEAHGCKVTVVELAQGDHPVQPMLTMHRRSTLRSNLRTAEKLSKQLRRRGVEVVRTKVEVDFDDVFAWRAKDRAWKASPEWLYAEQHVLVRYHGGPAAVSRLEADAESLGAHVSTTPRRERGSMEERFVTSRVYFDAKLFAGESNKEWRWRNVIASKFGTVTNELRDLGWGVVNTDREVVLHDTNLPLDSGWLPDTAGGGGREPGWHPSEPSAWPASWSLPSGRGLGQQRIFDPSVKDRMSGFRRTDPDQIAHATWHAARRALFDEVLAAVASSPLRDSLCVRGSVLLSHYLGDAARSPGDIDFVVVPSSVEMTSEHGLGLVEAMRSLLVGVGGERFQVHASAATVDSIWTYERVPGRRLTVPWSGKDVEPGQLQMDFVFGEELWQEPVEVDVGTPAQAAALLAASPQLSLAWKILWLDTDRYPQGKDLYDAVLLAEMHPVDLALIRRAFDESNMARRVPVPADRSALEQWPIDRMLWEDFLTEHPTITGSADDWVARLAAALFPDG